MYTGVYFFTWTQCRPPCKISRLPFLITYYMRDARIRVQEVPKIGVLEPDRSDGSHLAVYKRISSHMCYRAEFGRSIRQTVRTYIA